MPNQKLKEKYISPQRINLFVAANNDTLIKGSTLQAKNSLTLDTKNLNIFASRNTANSSNKTEQGSITIAQTVWGAAGGPTVNASMSRSRAQNGQTTYTNSTLRGKNLTLITKENATLRGATVRADETLVASIGGDLTIESVQNRTTSNNNSFSISGGFGFGKKDGSNGKTISGAAKSLGKSSGEVNSVNAGLGASSGRSTTRETVLTSLTSGGTADITVKGRTQLNGALLATTDKDNNDLGNLSLTTGSFGFEDFSNTTFNTNRNAGLSTSVGFGKDKSTSNSVDKTEGSKTNTKLNTTNVQYSNSTGYEKTKTLATLGKGNIVIANNDDATNLDRLNRDTKNISKDIFNTKRQQGNIDLTIDTRLFSEEGRNQILDDVKRTKIGWDAITDLGDKSVSFFGSGVGESSLRKNLMNKQTFFSASKIFGSKANRERVEKIINGNTTRAEQEVALTAYFNTVANELNLPASKVMLLYQQYSNLNTRENKAIRGAFSKETKSVFLVDNLNKTTGQLVQSLGNELSRYMDDARDGDAAFTKTKSYRDNRKRYSDIMGEALRDYTSFTFAMNGYDSLTATNTLNGTIDDSSGRITKTLQNNIDLYNSLNPNEIEYRQFTKQEAGVLDRIRLEIEKDTALTTEQKKIKTHRAFAIACAEVNCAKGVSVDVSEYKEIKALQDLGEQLKQEGKTLASLTTTQINADLFNYNWLDRTNDFLSRNDEARIRTGGVIRSVAGGAGMFGGATLTAGGYISCGATFGAGCAAATVGGIPLTYLSYTEARDGINQTFGVYQNSIGKQVIDSFSLKTHQGNLTPLQNMGLTTVIATGEIISAKVGGMYIKKGVEKWKKSKVNRIDQNTINIDTNASTKGSYEYDVLNNVGARKANMKYDLDNGNSFTTNKEGFVEEITFTPINKKIARDSRQTAAGKKGRATDVGGHAQACSQGGTCDGYNLFPQDANFNNSAYKVFYENKIKKALNNPDKKVGPTTIKFNRKNPSSARPDTLEVTYTIDGKTKTVRFENKANITPETIN